MKYVIDIIGSIAACLTTTALLPQVITTIKTKKTGDLSLTMYILFCIGIFLWFIYGLALHSAPLIISNIVTLFFGIIILISKLRYG